MPSATATTAPATTTEKVLNTLPSVTFPPKTAQTILQETEAQWLFTGAELARSPSIIAGMTPDEELHLRAKGLSFIMQVGIMLKLPQITLYTASLFFNRFLMRYSLISTSGRNAKKTTTERPMHVYQIGALALHTSTKVSETPRKLRDIITACVRVALHDSNLLVPEDSKDFWRWRDTLLMHEDLFLETLCFDLTVESPHRLLFDLLKNLGAEHKKRLRNAAWAFVNDAGVTTLGLRFSARVVAAAAIYAASKHCEFVGETEGGRFKDDHRTGKPWWAAHSLDLKDIRRCCNAMADFYEANPEKNRSQPGKESANASDEGSKDLTGSQSLDGVEESIYTRLRTPSEGPEDGAPTRLMRKRDVSTKRSRNGTPKLDSSDGRNPDPAEHSHHNPEQNTSGIAAPGTDGIEQEGDDERAHKKNKTHQSGSSGAQAVNGMTLENDGNGIEGSEEGEVEE